MEPPSRARYVPEPCRARPFDPGRDSAPEGPFLRQLHEPGNSAIGRTIEAEGKAAAALRVAVERKPMGLGRGGDRI